MLPAGKDVNKEAEGTMALEAVTKQRILKIHQTEIPSACCGEL